MPTFNESVGNGQESPARVILSALIDAEYGNMPAIDTDGMLEILKLDGKKPDGRTVADRLLGDSPQRSDLRAIVGVMMGTHALMVDTNERTANPAQEVLAKSIGTAITRQIVREGDICDAASEIALSSRRNDIIDRSVQRQLLITMYQGAIEQQKPAACGGIC